MSAISVMASNLQYLRKEGGREKTHDSCENGWKAVRMSSIRRHDEEKPIPLSRLRSSPLRYHACRIRGLKTCPTGTRSEAKRASSKYWNEICLKSTSTLTYVHNYSRKPLRAKKACRKRCMREAKNCIPKQLLGRRDSYLERITSLPLYARASAASTSLSWRRILRGPVVVLDLLMSFFPLLLSQQQRWVLNSTNFKLVATTLIQARTTMGRHSARLSATAQ